MYVRLMNPREQGDIGERSAAEWFTWQGGTVALPLGHSPDWDLVVELGDRVLRVQVKTSACFYNRRWAVSVCTRGGNQSWNGLTKRFSASRCDLLFAHVGDGRRWLIPADRIEGGTAVMLGGPKYAPYEIEPGRALGETPRGPVRALESILAPGGAPELESRAGL